MIRNKRHLKHRRALKKALNEIDVGGVDYQPTLKDVEKWFGILNKGAFKGEIKRPVFAIRRYLKKESGEGCWGIAEGWSDTKTDEIALFVYLTHRYPHEKMFINTLAHEMVHCYTFQQDGTMNHGRSFKRWAHIFKKYDIKL